VVDEGAFVTRAVKSRLVAAFKYDCKVTRGVFALNELPVSVDTKDPSSARKSDD
jgi:hypothetical protein